LSPLDKIVNHLSNRLERYCPSNENERYDRMMQRKFAKEREERVKNSKYTGFKAYEDAWLNRSQEELQYYRSKISPEDRYQNMKEIYYFHDSSSYMKYGDNREDNYGCTADACIPECPFYPKSGRIEEDGTVTH
jgi:hypothetical protein